jgi:adenine-specific DNA-methyltransferase
MKHLHGQYFTTSDYLKECVYKLILNDPSVVLEPSVGQGDLVEYISKKRPEINFDLYEIDKSIKLLPSLKRKKVIYGDFLDQEINYTYYHTIVGNPPYVKTQNGNLYLDFIRRCYELLRDQGGELIFIVPSDFIKLTRANNLINEMCSNGSFTHFIFPNDENLFDNASIDVTIFRYCKNKFDSVVIVNDEQKFLINTNGIITFTDDDPEDTHLVRIEDSFDIFVGMVTGKESVYKNDEFGNIKVLNGDENKLDNYILVETFPTGRGELDDYLLSNKETLISRKIKNFNEKNWFQWGALRNFQTIKNNLGKECIYISNLSRKKKVAFKSKVQYFGGGLIMMIPNQNIELDKIVTYLNSDVFKSNYMYSGRFKIGHKQLCNARLEY